MKIRCLLKSPAAVAWRCPWYCWPCPTPPRGPRQDVRVGEIHAGRSDTEAANIWTALSPREKVDVLRRLVEQNVARVLPAVLGKG